MEHVHVSGGKAIDPKDYCALCGYLRDERSVFVSLSGCPGSSNFEVIVTPNLTTIMSVL